MKTIRAWIHAIIWASWIDLGQPNWLLKPLKWINKLREEKDGFG